MTAAEIKEALRRRHPATINAPGQSPFPGPWTVVEEFLGVDLIAFSAHSSPSPRCGVSYARVGYEVKVSRSDYRRELLRPYKRRRGVDWCNAFFFAVPAGLLTREELGYHEPDWGPGDFNREPCRDCRGGFNWEDFIGPLPAHAPWRRQVKAPCECCGGRGYLERSRVEREAPTLWVPRDVGLVVIYDDGRTRELRPAPARRVAPALNGLELNQLVRWVSVRPDPRHAEIGAAA